MCCRSNAVQWACADQILTQINQSPNWELALYEHEHKWKNEQKIAKWSWITQLKKCICIQQNVKKKKKTTEHVSSHPPSHRSLIFSVLLTTDNSTETMAVSTGKLNVGKKPKTPGLKWGPSTPLVNIIFRAITKVNVLLYIYFCTGCRVREGESSASWQPNVLQSVRPGTDWDSAFLSLIGGLKRLWELWRKKIKLHSDGKVGIY